MVPSILARPKPGNRPQARAPFSRDRHRRARAIVPRLLQRPIFGDVFGAGRFALATRPCINRGLHAVEFMVIEPRRGQVLAVAGDKSEALARARALINDTERQACLWPDLHARAAPSGRKPSRRRREIFARSGGRCHYCTAPLELMGPWHADHQQPQALNGASDGLNLVAACPACNLAKSDRTALEFFCQRVPLPAA